MYEIRGMSFSINFGKPQLSVVLRPTKSDVYKTVVMPVVGNISKAGVLAFVATKLAVSRSSISVASHINFNMLEGLS